MAKLLLIIGCCPLITTGCGGGGGGQDDDTGDTDGDTDGGPTSPGTPPPAGLKRLRSFEYRNSIADLLGESASVRNALPEDLVRANFTSVSAAQDCYADTDLEDLEAIALDVASRAFASASSPLDNAGCTATSASDACVSEFIASFGRKAWRRPLTETEVSKYYGLTMSLDTLYDGDVRKAVELTVAAMLQSPHFVYRVELGEPLADDPDTRRYSAYEMASRLSYTLLETTPDDTLLDAAENGDLRSAESVREHTQRMLADSRADRGLVRFWREHLNIDRLTLVNYPRSEASAELYAAFREEAQDLAERMIEPGTDALDFLVSDQAFLTPDSAEVYGLPEPDADGNSMLLPEERRGYLTSGLFLASTGHPGKTSPTRRGKFVLERILCREIPSPPGTVDLNLPDAPEGTATQRDLLEAHREDPACSGCHDLLDPPGFAFENFDELGEYRTEDNGLPVDASGEIDGQAFTDARSFIDVIHASPNTERCIVVQAMRSNLGHLETGDQDPYTDALLESFTDSGRDYRTLVTDIVSSDAFRFASGMTGED